MIYFLYGESSYHALRKIKEFKTAFEKKNSGLLVEEYDGGSGIINLGAFHAVLGQANLFSKTRLVIFKNVIADNNEIYSELKAYAEFLSSSKDVFIFWENDPDASMLTFFKKHSEKIQEVNVMKAAGLDKWLDSKARSLGIKLEKTERALMIDEAGENAEWGIENELEKVALGGLSKRSGKKAAAPSPFAFVDKMFGSRALLALKEMSLAGIAPQQFIYAFLWKLKQRRMYDVHFDAIKVESAMRRDPKNAEEILERFVATIQK